MNIGRLGPSGIRTSGVNNWRLVILCEWKGIVLDIRVINKSIIMHNRKSTSIMPKLIEAADSERIRACSQGNEHVDIQQCDIE